MAVRSDHFFIFFDPSHATLAQVLKFEQKLIVTDFDSRPLARKCRQFGEFNRGLNLDSSLVRERLPLARSVRFDLRLDDRLKLRELHSIR